MKIIKTLFLLTILILGVGCSTQQSNTFKPHAYANIKTWDVDFMFVNAPLITETKRDDATGKDVRVTKQEGQPNWALSIREDVYYSMLGRHGFKMTPKGTKADATVMLSFDAQHFNGNIGIINLTVFDKNGEPLSRLKYENVDAEWSLKNRERIIEEIVGRLTEEVLANK
jgi:hypothetical protein